MNYQFYHPFSAVVAGPSGCGKSQFILNFLKAANAICSVQFKKIYWYYDEMQPLYKNLNESVHLRQGLPDMQEFDGADPVLIIIDDFMREANNSIVDIFTKGSHHRNISVFFITQNIFHQGRGQRDISLNAHYIILFKNPRDRAQIKHLSRQISPNYSKFLEEAYNDATSEPHGYLLFDLKQKTLDMLRYRTSIFRTDGGCTIYVPKKQYKNLRQLNEYFINA